MFSRSAEEFFVIFASLETDSANAKELFAAAEAGPAHFARFVHGVLVS